MAEEESRRLSPFDALSQRVKILEDKINKGQTGAQARFLADTDAKKITYKSNATADTEDAVTHNLGRVPDGFFVTSIDKGGQVYMSNKPSTAEKIYLKCSSAAANVSLTLF